MTYLNRSWVVSTSLTTDPVVSAADGSYYWETDLSSESRRSDVTFCVTEVEAPRAVPDPVPAAPVFNYSLTTANVDGWLAELSVPSAPPPPPLSTMSLSPALSKEKEKESDKSASGVYNSWFQFWFNTEHDAGHWIAPVITPSKSTYGRGMWLWDSAFHVMALASGGTGPRSLKLAGDQLRVLIAAGKTLGHIPRVVGTTAIETTTQPPGILTWASLVCVDSRQ